jgi:hypothetical protein
MASKIMGFCSWVGTWFRFILKKTETVGKTMNNRNRVTIIAKTASTNLFETRSARYDNFFDVPLPLIVFNPLQVCFELLV